MPLGASLMSSPEVVLYNYWQLSRRSASAASPVEFLPSHGTYWIGGSPWFHPFPTCIRSDPDTRPVAYPGGSCSRPCSPSPASRSRRCLHLHPRRWRDVPPLCRLTPIVNQQLWCKRGTADHMAVHWVCNPTTVGFSLVNGIHVKIMDSLGFRISH